MSLPEMQQCAAAGWPSVVRRSSAPAAASEDAAWVPQFLQAAIAVKAENMRLQEHVRLLEASLKQATLDIQTLKECSEAPADGHHSSSSPTPSTSASSSPLSLRPLGAPAGLLLDNLSSPPGLAPFPPPGLPHPPGADEALATPMVSPTGILPPALEQAASLPRDPVETTEWRIENVSAKLRTSCGFPLISAPFTVHGVDDLRFLFVPGEKWMAGARERKQKGRTARAAPSAPAGPANGALKLKVGQPERARTLRFKFFVGGVERGPVSCDFSEMGVQGVDLDFDWSKQIDSSGCLSVRFDFF